MFLRIRGPLSSMGTPRSILGLTERWLLPDSLKGEGLPIFFYYRRCQGKMPYHKLVRVTFCFESLQRIFARSRRANARAVSARVCVHLCARTCVCASLCAHVCAHVRATYWRTAVCCCSFMGVSRDEWWYDSALWTRGPELKLWPRRTSGGERSFWPVLTSPTPVSFTNQHGPRVVKYHFKNSWLGMEIFDKGPYNYYFIIVYVCDSVCMCA